MFNFKEYFNNVYHMLPSIVHLVLIVSNGLLCHLLTLLRLQEICPSLRKQKPPEIQQRNLLKAMNFPLHHHLIVIDVHGSLHHIFHQLLNEMHLV